MDKIDRVMAKFRVALLKKFHEKEAEGFSGWDCQTSWSFLVNDLLEHERDIELTPESLIDIALYCLFLWNLESK